MLNLSRESEVCYAFFFCQEQGDCDFQSKSDHMRKIFRSVLQVCCGLMHSGKPPVLKYDNRLCSSDYGFQIRNDTIIVGWKAIHHHRTNQNPHQRWSCPELKSALQHPSYRGCDQLFSRASGVAVLDAICTHSA